MRTYERSGVTVDQCTDCRGIFLDRGELERLVDAETRWHQAAPSTPAPYQHEQPYQHQQHRGGYQPHRRRKSFFEELFD